MKKKQYENKMSEREINLRKKTGDSSTEMPPAACEVRDPRDYAMIP